MCVRAVKEMESGGIHLFGIRNQSPFQGTARAAARMHFGSSLFVVVARAAHQQVLHTDTMVFGRRQKAGAASRP